MWILFLMMAWFAVLGAQVFVAPLVFGATLVAATALAGAIYFQHAARVLLPGLLDGPSRVEPPTDANGRDPVYRHYLAGQVWRDWAAVARDALPQIHATGQRHVSALSRSMLSGKQAMFLFPLFLTICAGVFCAVIPLTIIGGLLAAAYALAVAAGLLVWLIGVGAMRGLEQGTMVARRILQTCPYPDCYARIALPQYVCGVCGRRHRRLIPTLDGAFAHVCRCGASLPTTILAGRHRLEARCPTCDRRLPARIGRVRVEPLPFIGGPDAGKTTFLALAVDAVHGAAATMGGRAVFADEGDVDAYRRLRRQLTQTGNVPKTTIRLPRAVMLDVSAGPAGDRILYLFDPSGETFGSAGDVGEMTYLAHCEALLLVVDPFALPELARSLTHQERAWLHGKGVVPSRIDPAGTFARVRNELASRSDGGGRRRVAVVLTKRDLLGRIGAGRGAADDPRGWLMRMGLGNTIRDLEAHAGEVRYFLSGLPPERGRIAELVGWLAGLRFAGDPSASADYEAEDGRRRWAGRIRPPGALPLGYHAARRAAFGVTVLLGATVIMLLVVRLLLMMVASGYLS
jgi:hypothetical protein